MATSVPVSNSGDTDIDALLTGARWSTGALTYNFPLFASRYAYSGEPDQGFQRLPTDLRDVAREIFATFGQYANLTFTETTSNSADLRLAMTNLDIDPTPALARGHFPEDPVKGGDIWLNTEHSWTPVKGNKDYWAMMHEVGHALGLSHYNVTSTAGDPAHEGHDYSIMTNFSHPGATPPFSYTDLPQTPMLADIAALQYMYGANFNTRPLDTVYSWSQTTGETFIDGIGQGAPDRNIIYMTIWDGGGVDTYDFSNYRSDVRVDLRPGEWSTPDDVAEGGDPDNSQLPMLGFDVGTGFVFARGSIANAFLFNGDIRSLIENANGGSGNDSLIGNQTNNTLHGNGGDDTLFYTGGVDVFFGDAMGDHGDTADFSLSTRGVIINPIAAFRTVIINGRPVQVQITPGSGIADALGNAYLVTTTAGVELVSMKGIENLAGSRFGDTITGDIGNNTIKAGEGNDRIFYTGGLDTIDGEEGTDTIDFSKFGAAVSVTLVTTALSEAGTSDAATIPAGATLRPVAELANFENVVGSNFADVINGNAGDNVLDGGAGADRMSGGSGDDTYIVDNTGDRATEISGTGGTDTVQSSVTFTLGAFVEELTLTGSGAINGTGNDLDNVLTGNSANNTLTASAGNDTLIGGLGNDTLNGGTGNDTYAYSGNFGSDTIIDAGGTDRISITGTAVLEGTSRNGNDLIVTLSTGTIRIDDHFTTGTIESLQVNGKTFVLANGLVGGDLPGIISGDNGAETMDGRGGDDILYGNNGNDTLLGGLGRDLLDGGNGRDILDGGTGDDVLTGGRGGDTFVFRPGFGHDTITDFSIFEDRLDISGFRNWPGISRDGSTLNLDFGGGDVLSIKVDLPESFGRFGLDTSWLDLR